MPEIEVSVHLFVEFYLFLDKLLKEKSQLSVLAI